MRIINKRPHSITLSVMTPDAGVVSYTIDGQRQDPLDRANVIDGVNEDIPDDFVELAAKQSKVVQSYFTEGFLVLPSGAKAKAK